MSRTRTAARLRTRGESGELLIGEPQVFKGYGERPANTALAFTEIAGVRYLRTGAIAYRNEEDYFFMADRLKRMINASGFKVCPAEVENKLHEHPAIAEASVIRKKESSAAKRSRH